MASIVRFDVHSTLEYRVSGPATFVFNVAAAETAHQTIVTESVTSVPDATSESYLEATTGNRYQRIAFNVGQLKLTYTATIEPRPVLVDPADIRGTAPDRLPMWTLPYLVPSRYCQSDHLMRLAYREFGRLPRGYAQVKGICDWIYNNVDYMAGSTGPLTSAFDTATQRTGVCRDFAHLAIAFCRALNIPARFVSGYAYNLNPPDFHAMFEAWLGDRWYLFDPTRQVSPMGMMRIGTGRDAADVSFALIFGPVVMTSMKVETRAASDDCDDGIARAAGMAVASA